MFRAKHRQIDRNLADFFDTKDEIKLFFPWNGNKGLIILKNNMISIALKKKVSVPMQTVLIAFVALLGGAAQAVTGFGAALLAMSIFPFVIPVTTAAVISDSMTLPLSAMIAWQYRNHVNFKKVIIPAIAYIISCAVSLSFLGSFDLSLLKALLGGFLILLAIYSIFFASKIHLKGSFTTTLICALVSGCTSALFGIGGPLMGLYYSSIIEEKEEYLGSLNAYFTVAQLYVVFGRYQNGYLTAECLPHIFLAIVFIAIGLFFGNKVAKRVNLTTIKYGIYGMMIFSGINTLVSALQ